MVGRGEELGVDSAVTLETGLIAWILNRSLVSLVRKIAFPPMLFWAVSCAGFVDMCFNRFDAGVSRAFDTKYLTFLSPVFHVA